MKRRILIIEDSKDDFAAILRALRSKARELDISVEHSWDGDEALAVLHGMVERGESGQLPHVILLDLNLPGTDGREVLLELKRDGALRAIPVVVLTTSINPQDIAECYDRGVNGYCVKGGYGASFTETIEAFRKFWLEAAVLPSGAPGS
jgi:CheY-like chemotaxis protein